MVRRRADIEDDPFHPDSEIDDYINESIAELYGKLVLARGDEYYATPFTTTTVVGANSVALPATFFKILGVRWHYSGNRRIKMLRMDFQKFMQLDNSLIQGWTDWARVYYMTQRENVVFWPTPQSGHTITVWYIPAAAQLTAPADNFDGINGWERFVVLHAVRLVKMKRQESTTVVDQGIQDIEEKINSLSGTRDDGQPSQVIDVDANILYDDGFGWW
tara:strand:+ start:261 stop:914 length:654 start_codon:yes stop_codon:yes gene_type:complete